MKHELFVYGQGSADGWACRGCEWQSYNVQWTREEAADDHLASIGQAAS